MRRNLFSLCLLLGIVSALQAQKIKRKIAMEESPRFGFQAGLSIPSERIGFHDSNEPSYRTKTSTGFTGGIQVEIPLGSGWYIQPEANFTQMGAKNNLKRLDPQTHQYVNTSVNSKIATNYIQVPIYVKYKPKIPGLGIFFGPQYGYLLSYKETYMDKAGGGYKGTAYNNRNEISLAYGVEYYLPSKNDGPSFGIAFKRMSGLTNMMDKNKLDKLKGEKWYIYNDAFFLTIGVRF